MRISQGEVLISGAAEGGKLPIELAPTLKDRSAFKLTNAFWHSSFACTLLQKCLFGVVEKGARG